MSGWDPKLDLLDAEHAVNGGRRAARLLRQDMRYLDTVAHETGERRLYAPMCTLMDRLAAVEGFLAEVGAILERLPCR